MPKKDFVKFKDTSHEAGLSDDNSIKLESRFRFYMKENKGIGVKGTNSDIKSRLPNLSQEYWVISIILNLNLD